MPVVFKVETNITLEIYTFLIHIGPPFAKSRSMLGQSIPSIRSRFTGADFDFVVSRIAGGGQRMHLEKLWNDPDALREMLDLKEVFRGLLDHPSAVAVSPQFYFYVLVRHSFLQSDLDDANLADYVAGVMTRSISSAPDDPLQDLANGFTRVADFLPILSTARGRMRFHLQVAAGNRFLVLTGLYPDFLKARCERRGGSDLGFYEEFARQVYREAADSRDALGNGARQLFGTLAEALPLARRSLNRVAEEFVFLGD